MTREKCFYFEIKRCIVLKKEIKQKDVKPKEKKPEAKGSFFKNLKLELSKVKWPESKNIVKYTIATLVFVVILALFFEGLNFIQALIKGLFG